jgi:hypothetical protein
MRQALLDAGVQHYEIHRKRSFDYALSGDV